MNNRVARLLECMAKGLEAGDDPTGHNLAKIYRMLINVHKSEDADRLENAFQELLESLDVQHQSYLFFDLTFLGMELIQINKALMNCRGVRPRARQNFLRALAGGA